MRNSFPSVGEALGTAWSSSEALEFGRNSFIIAKRAWVEKESSFARLPSGAQRALRPLPVAMATECHITSIGGLVAGAQLLGPKQLHIAMYHGGSMPSSPVKLSRAGIWNSA